MQCSGQQTPSAINFCFVFDEVMSTSAPWNHYSRAARHCSGFMAHVSSKVWSNRTGVRALKQSREAINKARRISRFLPELVVQEPGHNKIPMSVYDNATISGMPNVAEISTRALNARKEIEAAYTRFASEALKVRFISICHATLPSHNESADRLMPAGLSVNWVLPRYCQSKLQNCDVDDSINRERWPLYPGRYNQLSSQPILAIRSTCNTLF